MPITLSPAIKKKTSTQSAGTAATLLRRIPSIDQLLLTAELQRSLSSFPHEAVVDELRHAVQTLRNQTLTGRLSDPVFTQALAEIPDKVHTILGRRFAPSLGKVINATGVVLHTNLGRAPLSRAILERIREVAAGYSNLEFDLAKNTRGNRDVHAERLLTSLLRCQAALVVNNCAAAVLLTLNSLAEGGEVLVSRGELVEIGGSFRIPEIMAKSGAVLREVGTTNRTRVSDYARAINAQTRLILRVHRSNFKMVGFSEQPSLEELVRLAHRKHLPLVEDLGSGCVVDLSPTGITGEPTVAASLKAGVDVITFSGDKLLGGPQAGILLGRKKILAQLRTNPLYRAFRVDKLTVAALEATILSYLRHEERTQVPALKMIFETRDQIESRAKRLVQRVDEETKPGGMLLLQLIPGNSVIGGGSTPGQEISTMLISIGSTRDSARAIEARLRGSPIPILARVEGNRVLVDLRTVDVSEEEEIVRALVSLGKPVV
ncbi:MAG: L-seryl-tRNA(Sec) selenium transferase [Acidobacteriia bacterium]|nr:L-seryl-tRNA(Sec) selenium transferase [Terriglobia bacterium]